MQTQEWSGLSRDQQLLWAFIKGVIVGHEPYISRKVAPVFHARWSTLATRILSLYIRQLIPNEFKDKLRELTKFVVQVYAPSWFT